MSNKKYPFLDLRDVTAPVRDEILRAVTRVIDSGRYIGGSAVDDFETRLLSFTCTDYAVGVSNGLDALRLIFRAYIELGRLRPGDEVIVPANTYIASVLAVTDNGLQPVFVEPDPATMNLDWTKAEQAVTDRTRAILPVHLYGRATWDDAVARRLKERGILIVEDNAQAIGADIGGHRMTGALGDAAAFSFYPTKNLGALGDAGAVTTNDEALSKTIRALANYGSDRRYHNIYAGYNCRLDPIQAAILFAKFGHLLEETERRRQIARLYLSSINHPDITLPADGGDAMVWHQFVVRTPRRDEFTAYLDANGIGWDIHYATPPHRQPCYSRYASLNLPITEQLADEVVSLPISPSTSPTDAAEIAAIINRWH